MALRRTGIKRRKRKGNSAYLEAREVLAEQAEWRCQAGTPQCNGQVEQVHHRKGRDGELLADPEYLLPLCYPCHIYIHANPETSYQRGWMVRRTV